MGSGASVVEDSGGSAIIPENFVNHLNTAVASIKEVPDQLAAVTCIIAYLHKYVDGGLDMEHSYLASLEAVDKAVIDQLLCFVTDYLQLKDGLQYESSDLEGSVAAKRSAMKTCLRLAQAFPYSKERWYRGESSWSFEKPFTVPQDLIDKLSHTFQAASPETRSLPFFDCIVMILILLVDYHQNLEKLTDEDLLIINKNFPSQWRSTSDKTKAIITCVLKKLYWDGNLHDEPGPYLVSLRFLNKFLSEHAEQISDTTTTGEVVRNIIIPETAEQQATYISSGLIDPQDILDTSLQTNMFIRSDTEARTYALADTPYWWHQGQYVKSSSFTVAFLSHAWFMPFRKLVQSAASGLRVLHTQTDYVPPVKDYEHISFLWIDVFCKNQHVPAPAMDEFERAMSCTSRVMFCLWPVHIESELPVSLRRIWCLYEIWTCLRLKKELQVCCDDRDLGLALRRKFDLNVRQAEATVASDAALILGLIEASVGVDTFNADIMQSIKKCLQGQESSQSPYTCFDGNGLVAMADGTFKPVRAVAPGDRVRLSPLCSEETAEVVLVTVDEVKEAGGVDVCEYQGLYITPEHPIYLPLCQSDDAKRSTPGRWILPKDFLPVKRVGLNKVFNFELDVGHMVLINGVTVLTLGNNLQLGLNEENEKLYGAEGWRQSRRRAQYVKEMEIRLRSSGLLKKVDAALQGST
eukprot:gene29782-35961_t